MDWFVRNLIKARHLQLLIAIDDLRSFSKVAGALHVTQPAVSKALAEIEKGFGVSLFQRTTRGVEPTSEGACVLRHGRVVLAQLSQMREDLAALMSGVAGKATVGVLPASAASLLPDSLMLLKQRAPGTTVAVREGAMDALLPELRAGNLDLIVGTLPPRSLAPELDEQVLFEDSTALVVRKGHPLTMRRNLGWGELSGQAWVLPPARSLLSEPLVAAFRQHGVPMPQNYIETLSVPVILRHLQITDVIASLPGDLALHYQRAGQLSVLPLELSRLVRPVGMLWISGRPLHPTLRLVMQCLEETAQRRRSDATREAEPRRAERAKRRRSKR